MLLKVECGKAKQLEYPTSTSNSSLKTTRKNQNLMKRKQNELFSVFRDHSMFLVLCTKHSVTILAKPIFKLNI